MIFGHFKGTNKSAHKVEASPQEKSLSPSVELRVDPRLPQLQVDRAGSIVIPTGRIVTFGYVNAQVGIEDAYKVPMTLHDGKVNKPQGMSVHPVYATTGQFPMDTPMPVVKHHITAEIPVVNSVNFAHGEFKSGDRITGYFGSTTSSSVRAYAHMGKPVKWTAEQLYTKTSTASASHSLTAATYPGFTPTYVAAFDDGVMIPSLTAAFTFNGTNWVVTLTGTGASGVTDVVYSYGQKCDQIAGRVLNVAPLTEIKNRDFFLQFATDSLNVPPVMPQFESTQVALTDPDDPSTGETPSTIVSGRSYRVANYPMDLNKPVTVYIQGTVVAPDGTSTTYSSSDWYTLPGIDSRDYRTYWKGKYHTVNWMTGIVEIAANITVTAIRVTYSYVTNAREALLKWGQGQMNLTDGAELTAGAEYGGNTVVPANPAGIPAHLNHPDVIGAARLWIE